MARFDRGARLAIVLVLGVLFACLFAPIAGDPYAIDPELVYTGSSFAHPLGTDELGRDLLARLLYGGRISLIVALSATVISVIFGSAVGLVAGFYGGLVDAALMRFIELAMVVPRLPLMILILAVDLQKVAPRFYNAEAAPTIKLVVIISAFGWILTARLCRASALSLKSAPFVEAAFAIGVSRKNIILKHVLPSALPTIVVAASQEIGQIIVYESVLSFLGLGIQPPTSSWGVMLADGLTHMEASPRMVFLPGLLTAGIVGAFHLLGDKLNDLLDPRAAAGLDSHRYKRDPS